MLHGSDDAWIYVLHDCHELVRMGDICPIAAPRGHSCQYVPPRGVIFQERMAGFLVLLSL